MERSLRATKHCRHYSYDIGLNDGPRCAIGCDVKARWKACMPSPTEECDKREEYTEEERAAWKAYADHRMDMLRGAILVFDPVECGTEARKPCPHCGGTLVLQRALNGHAWLNCTTTECVGPVHFNVKREAVWPSAPTQST